MKPSNPPLVWLNSLRGIAILAVILGHITNPYLKFIYSWHIPLFFFITGYLLRPGISIVSMTRKDIYRYGRILIIAGVIGILVELIKRPLLIIPEVINLFFWSYFPLIHNYGFVLWFLPALFWSKLAALLLIKILRFLPLVFVVSLSFWFTLSNQNFILPFSLDTGLLCLVWVVSGFFYRRVIENTSRRSLLLLFILPAFIFVPSYQNLSTKFVQYPLINYLYGISIIFILIYLSKLLFSKYSILSYLGSNSLFIYIFHPYIISLVYLLFNHTSNIAWIFQFGLSVIIMIVLTWLKNYVQTTRYTGLVNWV